MSADGAGALFHFLFLANFVGGASAYFFYFYFDFVFKPASESEDQGINLVWLKLAPNKWFQVSYRTLGPLFIIIREKEDNFP